MPVATESPEEKFELETVLKSGIFDRSRNFARALTYVCSKYFAGEAEQSKEYNIGVDALDRSADVTRNNVALLGPGKFRGGGDGSHLFDILCAGGADRALAQSFHGLQPDTLGKLRISLMPVRDLYPYINALEVVDETD